MIRRLIFCLIVLFCATWVYGRDIYMLSVGVSDYQSINDLHKTEQDAQALAELYRTHTSHVKTLLGKDATHDNVLRTMRTFFAQAGKEDVVVFYFSGHGGKNGICPYDTRSGNPQTLVSYAEIQHVLKGCKASNKQLFIDACFSGGFRGDSKSEDDTSASSSPLTNTEGIMLFLSSRNGETSQENFWSDNSYFTQYLLKGLKGEADKNNDRVVTAREIFNYVSAKVKERTKRKQNPVMWGRFRDDMRLF